MIRGSGRVRQPGCCGYRCGFHAWPHRHGVIRKTHVLSVAPPRFQAIIIDQTVGVVESYASHDLLAKNHPYIQLYLAENVRKGLKAVSNGQTYAFVGKDMEQRAAQLAELVENEAALIDRLKYEATVKDKFFSIIAHALKSPFDSLLGMTQMMSKLADRFSKDQLVEYATNVNEAGEQVFELLQNLLEWSRLQMEGARLDVEIVPLRELAQECINISKPVALEPLAKQLRRAVFLPE